jgi:hypothetical protein
MKIIDYENNKIKISDIPKYRKSKWLFSLLGERHEDRIPVFIGTLAECIRESKKHSDFIQSNDEFQFQLSCDYDYMTTTHPGLECSELAFDEKELNLFGVIEFINYNSR